MAIEAAAELARSDQGYIVAAAGYGKTQVLCEAAGVHDPGRQLVLTHTHAGVRAIRTRLAALGVPRDKVVTDTIAGFALRYASAFPLKSGLDFDRPTSGDWNSVYQAADQVLRGQVAQRVIRESYQGVYVDEYQDCQIEQHAIIRSLAEVTRCRLVGDPLQGIFDFPGQPAVKWDEHVEPEFDLVGELSIPWRWRNSNPALGDWLGEVRASLVAGRSINLDDSLIQRFRPERAQQVLACHSAADRHGTVVALGTRAQDCHVFARSMRGRFTSMEELECKDLQRAAADIDAAEGPARALRILELAASAITGIRSELSASWTALERGALPIVRPNSRHPTCIEALRRVSSEQSWESVSDLLEEIGGLGGTRYRRELWRDLDRAVNLCQSGNRLSLAEAAWHVRDTGRYGARRLEPRLVSRTLLVKGLEFDHAVVLNAEVLDRKNLYVALTRGSMTLAVGASTNIVEPA